MFMAVAVGGATYVVDPGFGPFAPRFPVPLVDSSAGQTTHWTQRAGNFWVLHVTREGRQPVAGWATTLEVENPLDFEVFNHYIATRPKSPFVNWLFLSGVVEDIITGLSHLRWMSVIARNSTFVYKVAPST
jgi:N-hydroxyarylamine O-acetyltransferase